MHISNFVKVDSGDHSPPIIVKEGANDSEKINDPKLKVAADYSIEWEFLQRPQEKWKKFYRKTRQAFVKEYLD